VIVYLNGAFLPADQACLSPLDRGFLFGDGIYEVIPSYQGEFFLLDQHLERLRRSLREIRMPEPQPERVGRPSSQSFWRGIPAGTARSTCS